MIEAKVVKLPEPEEVILFEEPIIDTPLEADGGALAKEPKKLGGPKATRAGRKPINKKK